MLNILIYLEFGCNAFLKVKLQLIYSIVCLTFINVQKQIHENPVFKSTLCSRCISIYDIYEL